MLCSILFGDIDAACDSMRAVLAQQDHMRVLHFVVEQVVECLDIMDE